MVKDAMRHALGKLVMSDFRFKKVWKYVRSGDIGADDIIGNDAIGLLGLANRISAKFRAQNREKDSQTAGVMLCCNFIINKTVTAEGSFKHHEHGANAGCPVIAAMLARRREEAARGKKAKEKSVKVYKNFHWMPTKGLDPDFVAFAVDNNIFRKFCLQFVADHLRQGFFVLNEHQLKAGIVRFLDANLTHPQVAAISQKYRSTYPYFQWFAEPKGRWNKVTQKADADDVKLAQSFSIFIVGAVQEIMGYLGWTMVRGKRDRLEVEKEKDNRGCYAKHAIQLLAFYDATEMPLPNDWELEESVDLWDWRALKQTSGAHARKMAEMRIR